MVATGSLLRCLALLALFVSMPLGAAQPPPLAAYGNLPGFERAAISPGGKMVAVVGLVKDRRRLLIFDLAGKPLRMAGLDDLKVRSIEWVGEDAVLLISSRTEDLGWRFTADSFEATYATVVPVDPKAEVSMIFRTSKSTIDSVFGRFGTRLVGNRWTGYFGGIELARSAARGGGYDLTTMHPTLFEVDLARNTQRKADDPAREGYWRDWLIGPEGRIAATFDMHRETGKWQIKGPGGDKLASGTDPEGDARLVTLGRDGKTLIFANGTADDKGAKWYEVPLDGTSEPVEVLADTNVDRLFIDKVDGRWLGYLEGGELPKAVFFDPELQKRADKLRRAFSRRHLEIVDWDRSFEHVIVHVSGNGDSGTWYMVDIANLKADPLGYDRVDVQPQAVGPISSFAYMAADGLQMDGVLTLPPGREAKNLPVVILPHGGPIAHDEAQFDWWAQAFASRGYAVLQPNFRGSTNRDAEFVRAGYAQWGGKMQTDLSDGLMALAKAGIVDPGRACIMGASYGGYAALVGVTLQQGIYRCSVAVAPVSDLKLLYRTDVRESGNSRVMRKSLAAQLGDEDGLAAVSPRRFAANADAPILLIHGKDDTVVPFVQSSTMADALSDAHKPFEFVVLNDEDHWLSRAATRQQMLEAAVAFVQKHNPAD